MSIIKAFSVDNGDMFYIYHNSDNFTTIDCNCNDDARTEEFLNEIKERANSKSIKRFISTHPDEDHIHGLLKFEDFVKIINFYCVKNEANKIYKTKSFDEYCRLRDSNYAFYLHEGCSRKWMNVSSNERGEAGIECLWPILNNEDFKNELKLAKEGKSFNNISPIITYLAENSVKAIWLGDMESTFLEKIKSCVKWPRVDILFAPHHGRDSGKVPSDVLGKLKPQIIVIGEAPCETLNYYNGFNTITQNSSGSIVFECLTGRVHVYVENRNYAVKFLDNGNKENGIYGNYIGSFTPIGE